MLYSPSRQMTFYMVDLRLRNSKCGITVHMYTRTKKQKTKQKKKKFNSQAKAKGVKTIG